MTTKPTLGQILGMAGGLLLFIFGFLDWYSGGGYGQSGWGIPVGNWAPLLGIITAAVLAVIVFVKLPQLEKMDFKASSLMLASGLLLTLDTFSFIIADHGGSVGAGLILSFISALVLLAGGVLDTMGIDPIAGTGTTGAGSGYPPQAYGQPGYGQPPAGYPQPGQAPPPPSAYPPAAPPAPATPPPATGAPSGTETQVVQPNPANPGPPPVPGQGF